MTNFLEDETDVPVPPTDKLSTSQLLEDIDFINGDDDTMSLLEEVDSRLHKKQIDDGNNKGGINNSNTKLNSSSSCCCCCSLDPIRAVWNKFVN